ncbi:MAG: LPS export ABC transporter permease LptF [Candidatus Competibacterales bacterium]
MALIDRYLALEVAKPFAAAFGLLLAVFAAYLAAGFLSDATAGLLTLDTVFKLVGLRTLIALETLLPATLFFAIVVALGRLHSDAEMTALAAAGVGSRRLALAVVRLALPAVVVVVYLSVEVRPWAYAQSHGLRTQAMAELELHQLEASRFHVQGGERVLFARQVDHEARAMEELFIKSEEADAVVVITAHRAHQPALPAHVPPELRLENGHLYHLALNGQRDLVVAFDAMTVWLAGRGVDAVGQRDKATPTWQLAEIPGGRSQAEFQWRLSRGLSTLLLALLALPVGRMRPRRGRYARVGMALATFVGFFQLELTARTWVRRDMVETWPGLWWVYGLVLAVLVGWLWGWRWPRLPRHPRRLAVEQGAQP